MSINDLKLKFKNRGWVVVFAILGLLLLSNWLVQLWLGPKVQGFAVVKGELIQTVVASGRVQSPARVEIGSKITGKVISIPVIEGQSVRAGQTLIVLESSDEKANVEQAKASVNQAAARLRQIKELTQPVSEQILIQAQASLDSARKQYQRTKELTEKGYVSQSQLDDSMRNLAITQSQVTSAQFQARSIKEKGSDYMFAEFALKQAQASERAAQTKLSNTVIKAITHGTLISRSVEQGNVVTAGKTLMVMSPGGKTQIVVQIDEKNMRYLQLGQQALIVADAYPGQSFKAELSYINPAVDASRGSVEVKLDVVTPPDFLRQDMTVSVDIEVARRTEALSVSTLAIRDGAGAEPWVMVNENGRALRRAVKLGVRGDTKVETLQGLQAGDQVLPATGVSVTDGLRVRVSGM